ncbi:MAG: LacI family DNA-binding transcriptional regulator [Bilophila wadsworthia]
MNENGFNNTRATIKDVAVKANVSLSTVSRALREPDKTPAETVSKVRPPRKRNYVTMTAGSLSKGARTPSASSCLPRRMRRSA